MRDKGSREAAYTKQEGEILIRKRGPFPRVVSGLRSKARVKICISVRGSKLNVIGMCGPFKCAPSRQHVRLPCVVPLSLPMHAARSRELILENSSKQWLLRITPPGRSPSPPCANTIYP